jgi:alpha-galactosidase
MRRLCPDAVLINYANPMAMACWYLSELRIETVGLCHSVQGTSRMLARHLDVPYEDVRFRCAGINHQAWFTELRFQDGTDLYPRLRGVMKATHLPRRDVKAAADHGEHSDAARGASIHEGAPGVERVRTELMAAFGYFHTESSHHASEYVPYSARAPS